MHTNGARIVSQHLRDGKVINEASVEIWDYYQNASSCSKSLIGSFQAKTSSVLVCYYDTPDITAVFEQETKQEMCINSSIWCYPITSRGIGFCGPNFPDMDVALITLFRS
jgi:hypothetical protein